MDVGGDRGTGQWDVPGVRLAGADKRPAASPNFQAPPAWLIFVNHRRSHVAIEWIDFEGLARVWHTLRPGEELLQDAYVGHAWAVREGDRELGSIIVAPGVGYVEIE
jgi:hypothetical protein